MGKGSVANFKIFFVLPHLADKTAYITGVSDMGMPNQFRQRFGYARSYSFGVFISCNKERRSDPWMSFSVNMAG